MRVYQESDIFKLMNRNNAITNALTASIKNITTETVINGHLTKALNNMKQMYKETICTHIISAVENSRILVICPDIDKRFPANIPFAKINSGGSKKVIVDLSKYCNTTKNDLGKIVDVDIDPSRLYNVLVPALLSLELFNNDSILPSESIKRLAVLWAKMFNKVLISKKIFIGNKERYDAFMYFAMRFFMKYYLETPDVLVEKISKEYIGDGPMIYIKKIQDHIDYSGLDIYKNFKTFATTMFSNEVTNIKGDVINIESFLKSFDMFMGKDGSYMSLWSPDYFLYCLFITYNKAYILNDRAWEDVVKHEPSIMIKLLSSLYKEV